MLDHVMGDVMKKSGFAEPNASHEILRHVREFSGLHSKELLGLFKETASEWIDDRAPRLGASLAFYTLLSLAPLLIVIVAVAAVVYGQDAARGQLVWQIRDLVGPDGAKAIQGLIQSAYKPGTGVIASLLGVLTLAFGASSVVVELRDTLNTIWHVPLAPRNRGFANIFRLVKERFYSFALILGVGFLLLVSLVLNAWIAAMGSFFGSFLPTSETVLHAGTFLFSFFVISFLFAAIYKLLPDVRLTWSDVAIGASVTSLLFTIGKQLIGLYLGKASSARPTGGPARSLSCSSGCTTRRSYFPRGAEFTKVYTRTFGSQFSGKLQPIFRLPPIMLSSIHPPKNPLQLELRCGRSRGRKAGSPSQQGQEVSVPSLPSRFSALPSSKGACAREAMSTRENRRAAD
jgi:membrane protein